VTATAIDKPLLTPLRVGGLTLPPTLIIGLDRPGQVGAAKQVPRRGWTRPPGRRGPIRRVNPKRVTYEIFGPEGTVATINYLDLDAQPQEVKDFTLPSSITMTTTAPAASANVVAQGDGDAIGRRITVNDVVKDDKSSDAVNAQTFCLVKSA
jgi:hypothetical protein